MNVEISKENFSRELFDEIFPLSQKCWDENTAIKGATCAYFGERDFSVDPDFDAYTKIASNMVIVTLRKTDSLVGYIEGFVYRSMHHKKIVCGFGDSIFVEPEYRSYTLMLAERFEKEMRELSVQIIGWPTHINGPMYKLLSQLGYVGDDIVMEKRLCVSQLAS